MMKSNGKKEVNTGTKKPEDNTKQLETIRKQGSNKQCFDCGENGTTYVTNFSTFVCSRCAGLLRDLNFKVKGIGVCNFSDSELNMLMKIGNENAKEIWLNKFDSKKDKLPDRKDTEAVRRHITAKYKDKKFAVKDPDKAASTSSQVKDKSKVTVKADLSSDSESSDSDVDDKPKNGNNVIEKNSKITNENRNSKKNEKLPTLQIKTSLPNTTNAQPNTVKNSMAVNNLSKEEGWANFSSGTPAPRHNSEFQFSEVFDKQINGSNSKNKNNFDQNIFTPNNETQNIVKNTSSNTHDWGIVWGNNSESVINNTTNFNNTVSNNNHSSQNQINPSEFNFIDSSTGSNINNSNDNAKNLSQTLNNLYHNNLNTSSTESGLNKKIFDDIDKCLGDQSLFSSNMQQNNTSAYSNNTTNYMNMNLMNMLGVSNNMFMMHPQMIQQMQMMMLNPQMQNNPQIMQLLQVMMQNMMNVGPQNISTVNNSNMNPKSNNSDNTINRMNQHQEQKEEPKSDLFKDIYNYSQNSKKNTNGQNNLSFNINTQPPTQNLNNQNNMPINSNNMNNSQTTTNNQTTTNSMYNPFDFY